MNTNANAALLLGRVLASAIFILGGYGKLMAAAATQAGFANIGVPMPHVAYPVSVAIELGGGLLLLLGLQTRFIALVLAAWCIATAALAHTNFAVREQEINFLKNVCMCGGFLAFWVAGPGTFSLDALMTRRRVAV
ncbi:MAG: DoxX family protein [Acetobacteraceae bacterium]|nr:DoxX family protein [Acetobacteraceae bacterium]